MRVHARVIATVAALAVAPLARAQTTPEEIDNAANMVVGHYTSKSEAAGETARKLQHSITVFSGVTKVGQYIGGGGAVLFGLKEHGKYAGYSGAVSALFTLVDQLGDVSAKSKRVQACKSAKDSDDLIFNTTQMWKLRKNDADFQRDFKQTFTAFTDRIASLLSACDPDMGTGARALFAAIPLR
jgi:hypothetical protein